MDVYPEGKQGCDKALKRLLLNADINSEMPQSRMGEGINLLIFF